MVFSLLSFHLCAEMGRIGKVEISKKGVIASAEASGEITSGDVTNEYFRVTQGITIKDISKKWV